MAKLVTGSVCGRVLQYCWGRREAGQAEEPTSRAHHLDSDLEFASQRSKVSWVMADG